MDKLRAYDIEYSFRVLKEKTSDELSEDLRQLGKTSFIGFDFSAENIWSILLGAAEKAIMPLKKQAFLSADFNIIVGASLILQTYESLTRRVTGLTQWYGRFQDLTYREFQALSEKRRRRQTKKMAKDQSVEETLSGAGEARTLTSAEERERKERYQRLAQEVSEVSYDEDEEEEDGGGRGAAPESASSPRASISGSTDGEEDDSSFIMLKGEERQAEEEEEERESSLLQFGRFMKTGRREQPSEKERGKQAAEAGPPLAEPSPLAPRRVSIHTHRDAEDPRRRRREDEEEEVRQGDVIASGTGIRGGEDEKEERERGETAGYESPDDAISSSSSTGRRKRRRRSTSSSSSSSSMSSIVDLGDTRSYEKPVPRLLTTLDWNCESIYENLRPETPIKGAANITPAERNAIQCSLLHFLKREPKPVSPLSIYLPICL